ncbi:MAG: M60 family metallopeptidase, partial [Bacteroides sp.]
QNRTTPHSIRDNPTGMYVANTSEKLIVFVGDNNTDELSLEICNFKPEINSEYHTLLPGLNIIEPNKEGLIYIHNHIKENIPLPVNESDIPVEIKNIITDKTVKIHIVGGEINGYFDRDKHDNKFWQELVWGDKYGGAGDIDVIGHYAHTLWSIDHYKEHNTKNIVEIIEAFDKLIYSQMDFTGLIKYNKGFNNRAYMHIIYSPKPGVGAYSSSYRTAYNYNGYANIFCTLEYLEKRVWVVGHEVGHSNQVRPGFRWHGTTEVTNNLCALYNQEILSGRASRLYDGNEKSPFEIGKQKFINTNLAWSQRENDSGKDGLDMSRLVPLWQLKLYFVDVLGQKDFYKDFYEYCRTTDYSFVNNTNHGQLMLDFIRQVCRIGNQNMLDFFETWGFLRPFKQSVNDYGHKTIEITEEQVSALKTEIESMDYPKPQIPVHEITDYNWPDFKNKLK